MKLKAVSGIMLTLLLTGMLTLAFNIQPVEASETIYIRADGSVDPDTAPISTVDNITYTFTDNIYDEIVVERDNIVIDGAGYTIEGTGAFGSIGIGLKDKSNVTIKNMEITEFDAGIILSWSSNNTISGNNATNNNRGIWLVGSSNNNSVSGNNATNNGYGISLGGSSNNTISGNNVTANNYYGIYLLSSSNNTISGNTITNNDCGIILYSSSNNTIYHNNFINNTQQVSSSDSTNTWDDSYPSGGNCWSDYTDTDLYYGPYQNETGNDGIWDHPYVIDGDNQDNYPIVPEFPSFLVLPLFTMATLLAVTVYRRRYPIQR